LKTVTVDRFFSSANHSFIPLIAMSKDKKGKKKRKRTETVETIDTTDDEDEAVGVVLPPPPKGTNGNKKSKNAKKNTTKTKAVKKSTKGDKAASKAAPKAKKAKKIATKKATKGAKKSTKGNKAAPNAAPNAKPSTTTPVANAAPNSQGSLAKKTPDREQSEASKQNPRLTDVPAGSHCHANNPCHPGKYPRMNSFLTFTTKAKPVDAYHTNSDLECAYGTTPRPMLPGMFSNTLNEIEALVGIYHEWVNGDGQIMAGLADWSRLGLGYNVKDNVKLPSDNSGRVNFARCKFAPITISDKEWREHGQLKVGVPYVVLNNFSIEFNEQIVPSFTIASSLRKSLSMCLN